MYQTTIKIEGFVTILSESKLKRDEIPVFIDALSKNPVESDIISKKIVTEVKC